MEKNKFIRLFRYVITFGVVCIAITLGVMLWQAYMNTPWTRDGRVRADVTLVAPDVPGLVREVYVKDNQHVRKGEKLFELDKARFREKIKELQAVVKLKEADYLMKEKEYQKRFGAADSIVSKESKDNASYRLKMAREALNEAKARLDMAELDLERSTVYAAHDGWVSNLLLKEGDYLQTGESRMAVINEKSFWVYGYFEENKIPLINIADEADMTPLGTDFVITGHVESIANGITDRDNVLGGQLLSNVNPSFTWVRLAQRIPVRITIESVPENLVLRAGMTCTVKIKKPSA